jgi:hypothetical protein
MEPSHNLEALLIGTGEFAFSEGAVSVAAARLAGYLDFGNIKALTPSREKAEQIHKGSYRGRLIKDRTLTTEESVIYNLQCEEWDKTKLRILFGGSAGSGHTQAAQVGAIVDAWEFSVGTPSVIGRWYPVTTGAAHLIRLTTVHLLTSGTGTACQGEADTEFFTAVAHGLVNGDTIIIRGGTLPTGITANQLYYVVNKTNDTFQVSLTAGGSAVTYTTDGTGNSFYPALIEDTDFEVDLLLGRIRLLAEQTTTITPIVSAPAIEADDEDFLHSVIPLDGDPIVGYGRLVVYDQDDKQIVLDHRDFKCEITAESGGAINGTDWSEIQLKVTVSEEAPGECFVREG